MGAAGKNCSTEQRIVAARAMLDAQEQGLATPAYRHHAVLAGVSRPGRVAKRFSRKVKEQQPVSDAPRSGRPRKFTDEEAAWAVDMVEAGVQQEDGSTAHYLSQWDAVRLSPQLSMLCRTANAHTDTLWRAMQRVQPALKKRLFKVRPILTPQLAQQRQQYAASMLQMPLPQRHAIVWLDAKKLWVKTLPHCAWVNTATAAAGDLTIEDSRAQRSSKDSICLNYYAAVSAAVGAVSLEFVTGTTGFQTDSVVSSQRLPPYDFVLKLT